MTSQSGGTVSGYPGVASDGADGLVLDGGIQTDGGVPAHSPTDGTIYNAFAGASLFTDTPSNVTNQWDTLDVLQETPLTADSVNPALYVARTGALNGHDYTEPLFSLVDTSAATGLVVQFYGPGGVKFRLNKAGGIGVYGHVAPTAQPTPTIATSTITDAVAKAAVKALILIINNCGLAAITET